MGARERFLVTGSAGCIGSWAMHLLDREGTEAVGLDLSTDHRRLRLLTDRQGSMTLLQGDITDTESVLGIVAAEGITHIVHLAALQIPFCQADPVGGAQVNVVGTINVLEAARRSLRCRRAGLCQFGGGVRSPRSVPRWRGGRLPPGANHPLRGLQAGQRALSQGVCGRSRGVVGVLASLLGLRRGTGPGVDVGAHPGDGRRRGRYAYHIPFGGASTFQHAGEVARLFIAAARAEVEGAHVYNLGGPVVRIADVISFISDEAPGSEITYGGEPLPLPDHYDGSGLDALLGGVEYLSMEEGVRSSVNRFRELLADGLVKPPT